MRAERSPSSPPLAGHPSALVGYTPELQGTLLELREGGGPGLADPGNAFCWVVVGTRDLNQTMMHLEVWLRTTKEGGVVRMFW